MKSPESELTPEEKRAYDIYLDEVRQSFRPKAFQFAKLWIGKGISDEAELRQLARIDVGHQTSLDLIAPATAKNI